MAVQGVYIGLPNTASAVAPTALEVQTALAAAPATARAALGLLEGAITPATLTADVDDYAPTGHATAYAFRLSSDASWTITSLAGGVANRMVTLFNIGAFPIVLEHASASGTAANKFACLGGASKTISAGGSIFVRYDITTARWRPIDATVIG